MVVIRLARMGAKKRPFYKVVVADQRCPRDGKYIESLGFYNPLAKGRDEMIRLTRERVSHWVDCGAQLSDRVKKLVQQWDTKAEAATAAA